MKKKSTVSRAIAKKMLEKMEREGFNLQFGGDFMVEDGYYLFNKNEVGKLYEKNLKRSFKHHGNWVRKRKGFRNQLDWWLNHYADEITLNLHKSF